MLFKKQKFATGCIPDPLDLRDKQYDEIALMAPQVDWEKGYDIEKELNITIPFKNQDGSSSCVGQGWAYYIGVLNTVETGIYDEVSAKAFYSQIAFPGGGAYIRDGAKLAVNWGAISELALSSYENSKPPSEEFMKDLSWKNESVDRVARILQAKEYRTITACDSMDLFAAAIRDNHGVVGGLYGDNNKDWNTNEPKPPIKVEWAHCLFYGKFGMDRLGRFIASPNSWNERMRDELHPDGWQKLREDYFNKGFQFNPWTLLDKPNFEMSIETKKIMNTNEKKIIMEGEGVGRKGIIINNKLREITNERQAAACLYTLTNNGFGVTVSSQTFNEMEKDKPF
ncbi:MAG: hypothetical protein KJ906_02700 [Nanoarchaeota archaeon]|nr:hypothetical protein [Nanoarchaeota archaeon]